MSTNVSYKSKKFTSTSNISRTEVKCGTLRSFINYMTSKEFTDFEFIDNFLHMYRFFSDRMTVARLLILRYMEIEVELLQFKESTSIVTEINHNTEINSTAPKSLFSFYFILSSTAKTSLNSKKLTEENLSKSKNLEVKHSDWLNFMQLRVLNIFKKWIEKQGADFHISKKVSKKATLFNSSERTNENNDSLCSLVESFLENIIKDSDIKKSRKLMHAVSILKNIKHNEINRNIESRKHSDANYNCRSRMKTLSIISEPLRLYNDVNQITVSNISELDPQLLAEQLTLLEHNLFSKIKINEFYNKSWISSVKNDNKPEYARYKRQSIFSSRLSKLISWFNKVAHGTYSEIINAPNITKKVEILKIFITVAKLCLEFQNFNSVFEIVAGLNSVSLSLFQLMVCILSMNLI